jgi:hypothetical protein
MFQSFDLCQERISRLNRHAVIRKKIMDYKAYWEKGMTANEYYSLVENLVNEGKTSGPNQMEALVHFTKLNLQRMHRIHKTTKVNEVLKALLEAKKEELGFLIITESWCGDAAQSVPVFTKLAEVAGVEVKLVLRDENTDLIDAHLTNGGRSIPIIVALNKKDWSVKFVWGPRPTELQQYVLEHKNAPEPKISHEELVAELQKWYNEDKQVSIQRELAELVA